MKAMGILKRVTKYPLSFEQNARKQPHFSDILAQPVRWQESGKEKMLIRQVHRASV